MAATLARSARQERLRDWRAGVKRGARRSGAVAAGIAISGGAVLALIALASYRSTDPSLNTSAADRDAGRHRAGAPGAALHARPPVSEPLLPGASR